MTNSLVSYRGRAGVWAVYDYGNGGPEIKSVHLETTKAIEALRKASYGKIAFLPFGEDVRQAISDWEQSE